MKTDMILLRCWNRCFAHPTDRHPFRIKRSWLARDIMRDNLRCCPKGKGNKAGKRLARLIQAQRDNPALLLWPDYLFPI